MKIRPWLRNTVVAAAVAATVLGTRAAWRAAVAPGGGASQPAAAEQGPTGSRWRLEVPGWVGALGGDDSLAVAVSANSVVTALDPATGSPVWAHEIRRLGPDAPAVSSTHVVVRADDRVVVLDRSDGARVWDTPVDGPGPVATVGHSVVLIGSDDGTLAAHSATDGELLWEAVQAGAVKATPVDAGPRSVVAVWHADDRAVIAALDVDDGHVLWTRDVGPAASGTATDGRSAYVGDGAGNVVALDLSDGAQRWSTGVDAGFGAHVAPAVDGGSVVIADRLGVVHALAATDGSPQWGVDLGVPVLRGAPTVAADSVTVTTVEGRAVVLTGTGEVLEISDDSAFVSGTVAGGGHLLLGLRLTEPGRVEGLAL